MSVHVQDVSHVVFDHPDLNQVERFYEDFGLSVASRSPGELVFRGAGTHPYCYVARQGERTGAQAIGMRVESRKVLEEAARRHGTTVQASTRPGAGWMVRFRSPMQLDFELVAEQQESSPLPVRPPLDINHGSRKTRYGETQRPHCAPATVLRLGHVALVSDSFAAHSAWLQDELGLRPSDLLYDGDPRNPLGGFFHCTGSPGWVDHHSIALFPAPLRTVHHVSFEVQDMDAQFMSNKYLLAQGYDPLWGVGRHILGSQVFDYWFDPDGNVVEHYTDGDLVRPGTAPAFHQVSDDALALWGPSISVASFLERRRATRASASGTPTSASAT